MQHGDHKLDLPTSDSLGLVWQGLALLCRCCPILFFILIITTCLSYANLILSDPHYDHHYSYAGNISSRWRCLHLQYHFLLNAGLILYWPSSMNNEHRGSCCWSQALWKSLWSLTIAPPVPPLLAHYQHHGHHDEDNLAHYQLHDHRSEDNLAPPRLLWGTVTVQQLDRKVLDGSAFGEKWRLWGDDLSSKITFKLGDGFFLWWESND